MALQALPTGNWAPAFADVHDALTAVNLVDAGNYVGGIGTIGQNQAWRVDRQNPPPGAVNVQIQRNGVGNPSTAAAVLVPTAYAAQIGALHGAAGPAADQARARFSELTRAIHNGLNQSARSHRAVAHNGFEIQVFQVGGDFSA